MNDARTPDTGAATAATESFAEWNRQYAERRPYVTVLEIQRDVTHGLEAATDVLLDLSSYAHQMPQLDETLSDAVKAFAALAMVARELEHAKVRHEDAKREMAA